MASLKYDLIVYDVEKATAPQTQRIAPLEDGPFFLLKDLLSYADHHGNPINQQGFF
ncbi:MAG TPA: hypothetical protein PKJ85_12420 [Nitrosomonas nitrosa]|nr:hypothetical protein [Nitrosomonas nitrosa]